jgi:hypothetical protein
VLDIPRNRRDQLRMNGVISGSPPQRRRLLRHSAEPAREVHQAVWQWIRLPPPDPSESSVTVLALVRREHREKINTNGLAIRSVPGCFWTRGIIIQAIQGERIRIVLPEPSLRLGVTNVPIEHAQPLGRRSRGRGGKLCCAVRGSNQSGHLAALKGLKLNWTTLSKRHD